MAINTESGRQPYDDQVLEEFDVKEDERELHAGAIESGAVPSADRQMLVQETLTDGDDRWQALLGRAVVMRQSRPVHPLSLEANDVLACISEIFETADSAGFGPQPWEETDSLIAVAQGLEKQAQSLELELGISSSSPGRATVQQAHLEPERERKRSSGNTSHYWSNEPSSTCTRPGSLNHSLQPGPTPQVIPSHSRTTKPVRNTTTPQQGSAVSLNTTVKASLSYLAAEESTRVASSRVVSPYFSPPTSSVKTTSPRRPRGVVSCVPFPPLTSPNFGLVQEKVAHDPFWLLIAVTFLIRTHGKAAIPVFYKLKDRFPTPADVANPANAGDILSMIRHLGLAVNRSRFLQKYARAFMEDPPQAGKAHRVRNYDRRDPDSIQESQLGMLTPKEDDEDYEAWEIGHMTQGKYAIDSWRIFCRDKLLGRANDWNGTGREPEFQPEWMRVMPTDKELRALLRWLWMKEGWEWDPHTGERTVLREEMRRAVNEGRVEYDDTGGLRMLDEPVESTG